MFPSAELRWFGVLSSDEMSWSRLEDWFCEGQSLPLESERVDSYLLFAGSETAGVKLREGKFEVKVLVGTPEVVTLRPGAKGRMDCWLKYSNPMSHAPQFASSLVQHGTWEEVAKRRILRKFAKNGTTYQEITAPNVYIAQGFQMELTRVQWRSLSWWSIALESFGPEAQNRAILHEAALQQLDKQGLPPHPFLLQVANSHSYPAWLNAFC